MVLVFQPHNILNVSHTQAHTLAIDFPLTAFSIFSKREVALEFTHNRLLFVLADEREGSVMVPEMLLACNTVND